MSATNKHRLNRLIIYISEGHSFALYLQNIMNSSFLCLCFVISHCLEEKGALLQNPGASGVLILIKSIRGTVSNIRWRENVSISVGYILHPGKINA